MRKLPPLAELIAFEAVARLSSFTLAAHELHLTQSAISHRILRLEAHYGHSLFRRLNPGIDLTSEGAALLPRLTLALDQLERLQPGQEGRRLRVAAGSALCTWWLAARLSRFMALRPDVSVELIPFETMIGRSPHVDIRILWVESAVATNGPHRATLMAEEVFPVCNSRLLPDGKPLAVAGALAQMPLLHKGAGDRGEWSWKLWFERLQIGKPPLRASELRFSDLGVVMSAAVSGAGVALSRSLLAHDALAAGSLTLALAPASPIGSIRSTLEHVARWPSKQDKDPDIRAFVEWLVAESQANQSAIRHLLER